MKAGGIESVRWPLIWAAIQPTAKGGYDWSCFDAVVETAARAGLQVLPSIGSTPSWLASKRRRCRSSNARQRAAWSAFLEAAVKRYGPGGEFWKQHAHGGRQLRTGDRQAAADPRLADLERGQLLLLRLPGLAERYAKLVTISSQAIKPVDPGAKVILAGLFGEPTATRQPRHAGGEVPRTRSTRCPVSRAASTASPCTPTRSTPKRWKNWSKGSTK